MAVGWFLILVRLLDTLLLHLSASLRYFFMKAWSVSIVFVGVIPFLIQPTSSHYVLVSSVMSFCFCFIDIDVFFLFDEVLSLEFDAIRGMSVVS